MDKLSISLKQEMQWLRDTAVELGGTVYGVAEESGFLSAFSHIQYRLESDKESGKGIELAELPDLFAVRQAVRAYEAECLIRRNIDPFFFLERLDGENGAILKNMEELAKDIFPEHWMTAWHENILPECSRALMYQVCYIRYFYDDIYRKVWDKSRKAGDIFPPAFAMGCAPNSLGIALGEDECFVVYTDAEGKTGYVPADLEKKSPENRRYCFRGSGDLCHAGIAYSEIALLFLDILKKKEIVSGDPVEKVSVAYTGHVPWRREIVRARKEREGTQPQTGKNTPELMADMQLEMLMDGRVPDGMDIIWESGTSANLPNLSTTASIIKTTANAYDARKEYHLEEGEYAIVLYLDNKDFCAGLVQKENGVLIQLEAGNPDEWKRHRDEWKCLKEESDELLKAKMKLRVIPKLKALGEMKREGTKEALETLAGDVERVKRQFKRCDTAMIKYENRYLGLTEELQISAYQNCMTPLYQEISSTVNLLTKNCSFSKIYLAGEGGDDPGLWEYLNEHYSAELCIMGNPEYVVALGATTEAHENKTTIEEEKNRGETKVTLWQGLAKYTKDNLGTVSLEGKEIGEEVKEFSITTIENWKVERIKKFTLKLPVTKNKMAFCEHLELKTDDEINAYKSKHLKVAKIDREDNTIRFYKICENFSEMKCDGTDLGYLEMTNKAGKVTDYYTFKLEAVPVENYPEGLIAFVDGSSGGKDTISYKGEDYPVYGGAYIFYKPGDRPEETAPFFDSSTEENEKEDIECGLMGISKGQGNVYGEINSAIRAIQKADELGYKKLRLYYDCEQIGGNAPKGAFEVPEDAPDAEIKNQEKLNKSQKITQKYIKFWDKGLDVEDRQKGHLDEWGFKKFANLEEIELIHVDAHGAAHKELNKKIDEAAKAVRNKVKEAYKDMEQLFIDHKDDYYEEKPPKK